MSPARLEELRANAMSDMSLVSNADVIECLDEIERLTEVNARLGACNVRLRASANAHSLSSDK